MHDMDRTLLEFAPGVDQEGENFEYVEENGFEGEAGGEEETADSPFSEVEEIDLANELLGITDEGELDLFIGGLMKRAARAAGSFLRSPRGRALGGILKAAARKALPILGRAAGGFIGGPVGGALGGRLASLAGQRLGLELEGLSDEDAQFEMARQFVRLGGAAAVRATAGPANLAPMTAAQGAMLAASRRYAPGLVPQGRGAYGTRTGRWYRRGRRIVLVGV